MSDAITNHTGIISPEEFEIFSSEYFQEMDHDEGVRLGRILQHLRGALMPVNYLSITKGCHSVRAQIWSFAVGDSIYNLTDKQMKDIGLMVDREAEYNSMMYENEGNWSPDEGTESRYYAPVYVESDLMNY